MLPDTPEWLEATYELRCSAAEVAGAARALATEQSVEMPLHAITDPAVLDSVVGRVAEVRPAGIDRFLVTLELSSATVGNDPTQLLNMLFGNCSLLDTVRLVDVALPPSMLQRFAGPRFGVAGLRAMVGGEGRALTAAALKPQGSSPAALASLAGRLASAGIDVIKDDHGLADQPSAPFGARVAACQRAVYDANATTGGRSRYAPSLVGSPAALRRQASLARRAGVEVVLVAPSLIGIGAFVELVEDELEGMAVFAHPAYAGAARVDPPLLLGALFRLFGADAVIFPHVGGRFAYDLDRCLGIAARARTPWSHIRPALAVPAGGMTPERVGEMLTTYGPDTMVLIGGALLEAGDGLERVAAQFVTAVAHGATVAR